MNAVSVKKQPGKLAKKPEQAEAARIGGVVIGILSGETERGEWLVEHSFAAVAQRARLVTGEALQRGMSVALMFEGGDPEKPMIIGPVVSKAAPQAEAPETLELEARKQIVLRCGHSSLTLTNAGKVILRGKYLLSRSSGVNRIKGASVQIN